MSENNVDTTIEQLQKQTSAFALIKKAFSSFSVLLLIGSGIVINWILALIFLFGYFSATSFGIFLLCLFTLAVIFPIAYFLAAQIYGKAVIVSEIYKEAVRPIIAATITKVLNKIVKDDNNSEPLSEDKIKEEFEQESGSFLDKIPDFISSRLELVATIKDIIALIIKQSKEGGDKEVLKKKISTNVFNMLDAKMEEIAQPSLTIFFIIGGINLVVALFIF